MRERGGARRSVGEVVVRGAQRRVLGTEQRGALGEGELVGGPEERDGVGLGEGQEAGLAQSQYRPKNTEGAPKGARPRLPGSLSPRLARTAFFSVVSGYSLRYRERVTAQSPVGPAPRR